MSARECDVLRQYHSGICKVLDATPQSLVSFVGELYSRKLVDMKIKREVLRIKGYDGADTLMDYMMLKVESKPQRFEPLLDVIMQEEALRDTGEKMKQSLDSNSPSLRLEPQPTQNVVSVNSTDAIHVAKCLKDQFEELLVAVNGSIMDADISNLRIRIYMFFESEIPDLLVDDGCLCELKTCEKVEDILLCLLKTNLIGYLNYKLVRVFVKASGNDPTLQMSLKQYEDEFVKLFQCDFPSIIKVFCDLRVTPLPPIGLPDFSVRVGMKWEESCVYTLKEFFESRFAWSQHLLILDIKRNCILIRYAVLPFFVSAVLRDLFDPKVIAELKQEDIAVELSPQLKRMANARNSSEEKFQTPPSLFAIAYHTIAKLLNSTVPEERSYQFELEEATINLENLPTKKMISDWDDYNETTSSTSGYCEELRELHIREDASLSEKVLVYERALKQLMQDNKAKDKKFEIEHDMLKKMVAELQGARISKEKGNEELQKRNEELQKRNEELQNEIDFLDKENEEQATNYVKLRKECTRLRESKKVERSNEEIIIKPIQESSKYTQDLPTKRIISDWDDFNETTSSTRYCEELRELHIKEDASLSEKVLVYERALKQLVIDNRTLDKKFEIEHDMLKKMAAELQGARISEETLQNELQTVKENNEELQEEIERLDKKNEEQVENYIELRKEYESLSSSKEVERSSEKMKSLKPGTADTEKTTSNRGNYPKGLFGSQDVPDDQMQIYQQELLEGKISAELEKRTTGQRFDSELKKLSKRRLLSDCPTVDELDELLKELVQWKEFGINLKGIKNFNILGNATSFKSLRDQKLSLYKSWLTSCPDPTWHDVVTALKLSDEHILAFLMQVRLLSTNGNSPALDHPTVGALNRRLRPLVHWEEFGIQLKGISITDIKTIRKNSPLLNEQKWNLFNHWLAVFPEATWEHVVIALHRANEQRLAAKIEDWVFFASNPEKLRPTVAQLDRLLRPLVDWETFASHLRGILSSRVKMICKEVSTLTEKKLFLYQYWLRVYPYGTWGDVIQALKSANENRLASDVKSYLLTSK